MAGYFIGMHIYLRMNKLLIAKFYLAEFISISLSSNLPRVVYYITGEKYWQQCYILLNILIQFLRVLCLADSNLSGMVKVYYYFQMTNIHIQKSCFPLDYIDIFRLSG